VDALSRYYHQLVCPNPDCAISQVLPLRQNATLTLPQGLIATRMESPEYGAACAMTDLTTERRWRHSDQVQFPTTLTAPVPHCYCNDGGVKAIYTVLGREAQQLYLAFRSSIDLLKPSKSDQAVALLCGVE
jgi:hypothetical protein